MQGKGENIQKRLVKKISKSQKGKIISEEARRKMSAAGKEKVMTPEHRKNISIALREGRASGKIPSHKGRVHLTARNPDIFYFQHENGEIFIGTKKEFSLKYKIDRSNVNHLISGRHKVTKGWAKLKNENL